MDILSAEQDLQSHLSSDISNIKIEAYPDDPDTYNVMGPNGSILIRYNGSDYSDVDLLAVRGKQVSQERLCEWVITILYRNLTAHTNPTGGVYEYVEAVRESLTGYTIDNLSEAGIMYPIRDGFVSRDTQKKLWEYEIIFRHTIPEVEAFQ